MMKGLYLNIPYSSFVSHKSNLPTNNYFPMFTPFMCQASHRPNTGGFRFLRIRSQHPAKNRFRCHRPTRNVLFACRTRLPRAESASNARVSILEGQASSPVACPGPQSAQGDWWDWVPLARRCQYLGDEVKTAECRLNTGYTCIYSYCG